MSHQKASHLSAGSLDPITTLKFLLMQVHKREHRECWLTKAVVKTLSREFDKKNPLLSAVHFVKNTSTTELTMLITKSMYVPICNTQEPTISFLCSTKQRIRKLVLALKVHVLYPVHVLEGIYVFHRISFCKATLRIDLCLAKVSNEPNIPFQDNWIFSLTADLSSFILCWQCHGSEGKTSFVLKETPSLTWNQIYKEHFSLELRPISKMFKKKNWGEQSLRTSSVSSCEWNLLQDCTFSFA